MAHFGTQARDRDRDREFSAQITGTFCPSESGRGHTNVATPQAQKDRGTREGRWVPGRRQRSPAAVPSGVPCGAGDGCSFDFFQCQHANTTSAGSHGSGCQLTSWEPWSRACCSGPQGPRKLSSSSLGGKAPERLRHRRGGKGGAYHLQLFQERGGLRTRRQPG